MTAQSIVIEADSRGRMSISARDDKGGGHGYRLAGPKYLGDEARVVARCVLGRRDVEEIQAYLRIFDAAQQPERGEVDTERLDALVAEAVRRAEAQVEAQECGESLQGYMRAAAREALALAANLGIHPALPTLADEPPERAS